MDVEKKKIGTGRERMLKILMVHVTGSVVAWSEFTLRCQRDVPWRYWRRTGVNVTDHMFVNILLLNDGDPIVVYANQYAILRSAT